MGWIPEVWYDSWTIVCIWYGCEYVVGQEQTCSVRLSQPLPIFTCVHHNFFALTASDLTILQVKLLFCFTSACQLRVIRTLSNQYLLSLHHLLPHQANWSLINFEPLLQYQPISSPRSKSVSSSNYIRPFSNVPIFNSFTRSTNNFLLLHPKAPGPIGLSIPTLIRVFCTII